MADEGLVSAIVKRLKNQPFLFVLGIAVLLIGLLTSGTDLGTPEFRLILAMIGGLAFLVVVGYYVQAVLNARRAGGTPLPTSPPVGASRGSDGARAGETSALRDVPSPTYNVSAQGAVIGAIGSHATVTMSAAPPPPAPRDEPPVARLEEIDRARRNLSRLESKRALYAAGTEPRELLDEIWREQRRLDELTALMGHDQRPQGRSDHTGG